MARFLLIHVVLILLELFAKHSNQDAASAARLIRQGKLRLRLWGGVVVGGVAIPLLLLGTPALPWGSALAAVLALGGLWLWEDIWVRAGQALPLS